MKMKTTAMLLRENRELLAALKLSLQQIETLAAHAFSAGHKGWLKNCEAMRVGRRAVKQAEEQS